MRSAYFPGLHEIMQFRRPVRYYGSAGMPAINLCRGYFTLKRGNLTIKCLLKPNLKYCSFSYPRLRRASALLDVSELLGIDNKNARMVLKSLAAAGFLKTNHDLYGLDYSGNRQKLAYAEHLRSEEFLRKKKNGFVRLFVEDALRKLKEDSFILLIFGSTVEKPNPRDTDVLVIADSKNRPSQLKEPCRASSQR